VKKSVFNTPTRESKPKNTPKVKPDSNSAPDPARADLDNEDEEDSIDDTQAVDITMEETKRILRDYVYLTMKNPSLAGPVTPGKTGSSTVPQ